RRHTRFSRDWSSDVCSSDLFGGIGADASNTLQPIAGVLQRLLKMGRVRAVDHIVGRIPVTEVVDLFNGLAQGLASRQAAVGFHRSEERRVGTERSLCSVDEP